MKPYVNPKGKAHFSLFWGDKRPRKHRRTFKKSARQQNKKLIQTEYNTYEYVDWDYFNDLMAEIYDEENTGKHLERYCTDQQAFVYILQTPHNRSLL